MHFSPQRRPAPVQPALGRRAHEARLAVAKTAAAVGASLLLIGGSAPAVDAAAVNTAVEVVDYSAGSDPSAAFHNPQAALGELVGDTGYGGLNPFNPPFSPAHVVLFGPGGHLTLRTEVPFVTSGFNLGVFANNGISDESRDATGRAGSPPVLFSAGSRARVAFSDDGIAWEYLNGGDVITFDRPTNVYLDTDLEPDDFGGAFQPTGAVEADMAKPWVGELADLGGKSYSQIREAFDGSAGGNWLNLDSLELAEAQYVRFEATDARMAIDAIATTDALPEPSTGLALLGGLLVVARRRRRD